MNREEEYWFLCGNRKTPLCHVVHMDIFWSVSDGRSFKHYDENYWCMIEQLYMERRK